MSLFRSVSFLALVFIGAPAAFSQSTVPTVTQPIAAQTLGNAAITIDLRNHFDVPGTSGEIVQFETVRGRFNAELLRSDAPLTVANFLNYVNRGAYTNSIFHRSVPNFIIQSGGFTAGPGPNGDAISLIPADPAVQNEFKVPNTRGTLAMAKTPDGPNTATNQWFINLADNRSSLDTQNGGFTVFARVIGTGMTVADTIGALQVFNASSSLGSAFGELPLLGNQLTLANLVFVRSIRVVPILPANNTDPAVIAFTATSANTAVVSATLNGSLLQLTPASSGTTTVTIRATDTNGNTAETTFTATALIGDLPVIATHPVSQTVAPGGSASFNVAATGTGPLTYQWRRDGAAVAGATGTTLTTSDSGDYTVVVTNQFGSTTSRLARLVTAAPDPGRLVNLSVRSIAGLNNNPLIVGFFMNGGEKSLLIRGVGPTLTEFGVSDAIADPTLKLYDGSGGFLLENDDWDGTDALANIFASVGAFAYKTTKDAAFVRPVSGSHTVHVNGKTGTAATALVELYDTGTGNDQRLTNISALNFAGSGNNVLIAGFVINGNMPKKLLIRGVGPTLATTFGIADALADPTIEIIERRNAVDTVVATGNDWSTEVNAAEIASTATAVNAFALQAGSKDAALLITLPAGQYSAKLSAGGGTTGRAIIEIYEAP